MEGHRARSADAGPDLEVDVGNRLNALFPDHARDLGALLGRELCARACLSGGGLRLAGLSSLSGLGLAVRRALLLRVHVAIATLTALGLHVLAGLGLVVLGAHALRFFALHVVVLGRFIALHVAVLGRFFALRAGLHIVLRALVFGAARLRRLFIGLGSLHAGRRFRRVRRRVLLDGEIGRRIAACSGSLCVCEAGSGDQRRRSHRHQKAISHGYLLACLLARADNETGSMMFRDISGSAELVL